MYTQWARNFHSSLSSSCNIDQHQINFELTLRLQRWNPNHVQLNIDSMLKTQPVFTSYQPVINLFSMWKQCLQCTDIYIFETTFFFQFFFNLGCTYTLWNMEAVNKVFLKLQHWCLFDYACIFFFGFRAEWNYYFFYIL